MNDIVTHKRNQSYHWPATVLSSQW